MSTSSHALTQEALPTAGRCFGSWGWLFLLALWINLGNATQAGPFPTPDEPVPDRPVPPTSTGAPTEIVGTPPEFPGHLGFPLDPLLPGYRWVDALPGVTFEAPVAVVSAPGETNRLYVVERTGLIVVVTNLAAPTRTVFLDLREGLATSYLEAGLLGLAFHPGYATNRQFFVFRTALVPGPQEYTVLGDVLARFQTRPDQPDQADPASEVRLITQEDADNTHNAGDLQFGPDGYLYVTLGDESPPTAQTLGDRQPLHVFFGAVLRLDVDRRPGSLAPNPHPGVGTHYAIPPDNPLVGATVANGKRIDPNTVRTEFYAWGFRNPWRMAIDDQTGALYVGDVGNGLFEELNLLRPGGNYGWPYREGSTNAIYWFLAPEGESFDEPFLSYPHGSGLTQGNSIIGGVVHRGNALPELRDRLILGDVRSGHTWALTTEPGQPPRREWLCTEPGLVSFGRDPRDGEVLAAHYPSGRVMALRRIELDPASSSSPPLLPAKLSETGAFQRLDTLEPTAAVTPYVINAPFWSDHAIKQRWVSLPPGASGTLNTDGSFDYPAGTVWIKHFEMELRRGDPASRRRLETRFLVRNFDGVYGVTYRWNAEGTDATLVPNEGLDETLHLEIDGVAVDQAWRYPGRAECLRCHTAPTGFAAGFSLEQLNRTTTVGGVERPQLTWLQERGVLPTDLRAPHEIPALADPKDERLPVPIRARSYLTSNCASCHRPGWLLDSGAHWNALFPTPLAETDLLDGRLCLPGNPADSRVYQMVERTLPGIVMPPLGSNVRDEFGLDLLARWIRTMPQAPWAYADLGRVAIPGSAASDRAALAFTLSAAGTGFGTEETLPGVLQRPWTGDGLFEATLRRLDAGRSNALAGFLVASAPENAGRPEVSLAMDAGGFAHQFTTDRTGAIRHRTGTQFQGPVRFRAQRYGSSLTTFAVALEQGLGVQTVATLPAEAVWTAGLFTASGSVVQQAHASFDSWLWAEAQWTAPQSASILAYGTSVPLALTLTTEGIAVVRVEYFANEIPVADATTSPFAAEWSHPPAGNHALTAQVQLSDGRSFTTRARAITVLPPPAIATFLSEDRATLGDWTPRYGGLGNTLSNAVTQLAEDTQLSVLGGTYLSTPTTAFPAALPILPDGAQRSSGLWFGEPALDVLVDRRTEESYRLSLYFVDGAGRDEAVQIIEVRDPLTGDLLDRRSLSHFSAGAYLTWKVSGSLRITLLPLSPETGAATLAAVFLDRPRPGAGQAHLTQPTPGTRVTAPTSIALSATPANPERPPMRVEFLVDDLVVAEATGPDFTAVWDPALVGTHTVMARAYDEVNQSADSDAVQIEVAHTETRVEFLGTIPDAQGDWPRRVGSEGYLVAPWPASVAPNVQVALLTGAPYLWQNWRAGELVLDRRGALMPEGMREAACWTDPSALILHLDLLDGRPHVVTLYLVDWDTNLRRQRLEWLTPGSTNLLHTQTVSEFFPGAHLVYLVQGRAWLRLVPETINAVLSGVFIDPSSPTHPSLHGISSLTPSPAGVNLTWHSDHGRLYRLLYADGLGSPWAPFGEILTSEAGQYHYFDPTPPGGQSVGRFYRLEQLSDGRGPLRLPER